MAKAKKLAPAKKIKASAQKTKPKTKGKRAPTPRQIERQVKLVLSELLDSAESGTVRIAAAKALMEKIGRRADDEKEGQVHDREERDEAIFEARSLLAELAAAKSVGVCDAGAVD